MTWWEMLGLAIWTTPGFLMVIYVVWCIERFVERALYGPCPISPALPAPGSLALVEPSAQGTLALAHEGEWRLTAVHMEDGIIQWREWEWSARYGVREVREESLHEAGLDLRVQEETRPENSGQRTRKRGILGILFHSAICACLLMACTTPQASPPFPVREGWCQSCWHRLQKTDPDHQRWLWLCDPTMKQECRR